MVPPDVVDIGWEYFVVYLSCVYMYICSAGYAELPIVLLYLLRCLVNHMFKTRRNSGSLHRVIDEVLVLLIGLLVVYKIPDSGRRMAVIRKISPTSNMIGY